MFLVQLTQQIFELIPPRLVILCDDHGYRLQRILFFRLLLIQHHLVEILREALLVGLSHLFDARLCQWRQLESVLTHLFDGIAVFQYLSCMLTDSIWVLVYLCKVRKIKVRKLRI